MLSPSCWKERRCQNLWLQSKPVEKLHPRCRARVVEGIQLEYSSMRELAQAGFKSGCCADCSTGGVREWGQLVRRYCQVGMLY